jgi:hypothetical protein
MKNETNEDTILEGATGIYRRIDLNRASVDTGCLPPFDSDLDSLGFSLVGDLMCSALDGFLRCYAHPQNHTRALLLVGIKDGALNVVGLLFEANLSDGTSLTTTTSAAMKDMPEKGLYRRIHTWEGVHDLYGKHENHVNELKGRHGDVRPIGDTLLSVAESIDLDTIRLSS